MAPGGAAEESEAPPVSRSFPEAGRTLAPSPGLAVGSRRAPLFSQPHSGKRHGGGGAAQKAFQPVLGAPPSPSTPSAASGGKVENLGRPRDPSSSRKKAAAPSGTGPWLGSGRPALRLLQVPRAAPAGAGLPGGSGRLASPSPDWAPTEDLLGPQRLPGASAAGMARRGGAANPARRSSSLPAAPPGKRGSEAKGSLAPGKVGKRRLGDRGRGEPRALRAAKMPCSWWGSSPAPPRGTLALSPAPAPTPRCRPAERLPVDGQLGVRPGQPWPRRPRSRLAGPVGLGSPSQSLPRPASD